MAYETEKNSHHASVQFVYKFGEGVFGTNIPLFPVNHHGLLKNIVVSCSLEFSTVLNKNYPFPILIATYD